MLVSLYNLGLTFVKLITICIVTKIIILDYKKNKIHNNETSSLVMDFKLKYRLGILFPPQNLLPQRANQIKTYLSLYRKSFCLVFRGRV